MNALWVIASALSGVTTVFACVGLHKLYLFLQDYWFVELCQHGRLGGLNGGPCPECDYEAKKQASLPGAAEGGSTYKHNGSTYKHNEDDWFDQRRPAHPDRPDEDY